MWPKVQSRGIKLMTTELLTGNGGREGGSELDYKDKAARRAGGIQSPDVRLIGRGYKRKGVERIGIRLPIKKKLEGGERAKR